MAGQGSWGWPGYTVEMREKIRGISWMFFLPENMLSLKSDSLPLLREKDR